MAFDTRAPLERILCPAAPIDALGAEMIRNGLRAALREPQWRQKSSIDAVCLRLKTATNRSRVILPVLSVPHPAFLDTLISLFGEGLFRDLTHDDGTPQWPEIGFKPRTVRLEPGYVARVFALLLGAKPNPDRALQAAVDYCRAKDEADLFDMICTQAGLNRAYVARHVFRPDSLGPLKPNFALWSAVLFDECYDPDSPLAHDLLEAAYTFHNPYLLSAIIAAGGRPNPPERRPGQYTPQWMSSSTAALTSRHSHLALLSRLAKIGGTESLFAADQADVISALVGKETQYV